MEVSPAAQTVKPGAAVELTATPNFSTSARILWSVSGDPRGTSAGLSDDTGETVTYTAPMQDRTYTVIAKTIDDELSISGSAKITVDSFLAADEVTATTDLNSAVLTGSLSSGGVKLLALKVPGTVAAAGVALYVELDQSLNLGVYNVDRKLYATSSSAEFFAAGAKGLAGAALKPQTITTLRRCRGACVIRDAVAGTYYLKIENKSMGSVNYTLYAYTEAFADEGETANNSVGDAASLGDFDQGALESLRDEDYYVASKPGTLSFVSTSWSNARVEVTGSDGTKKALAPGETFPRLIKGDIVRVYGADASRAAAASVSKYTLEILPAQ